MCRREATSIYKDIEKKVKSQVKLRPEFAMLQTIPGIGIYWV
jgi:hypothetical protein